MSLFELDEFSQFKFSAKRKKMIHFSVEEQKKVEFLIKAMDDELKHKKIADVSMKRSALCMLLTLIFRHMTGEEVVSLNGDLLDYINEHCDERLTESLLAEKCSYSKEYFSRKFKQLIGKTFSQYLCECRLNKARDLLLNTRKTVDVILLESGFTSRGEFFKKFEQKFGETPLTYRKSQKSVLL
jgi:AraC-like DNA-binding protein